MIQTLRNAGSRISGLNSKLICNPPNHNYNKILKSDWLSTVLISAPIGQSNWTLFAIIHAHLNGFLLSLLAKKLSKYHVF